MLDANDLVSLHNMRKRLEVYRAAFIKGADGVSKAQMTPQDFIVTSPFL